MKIAAALPLCICLFLSISAASGQINSFPYTQSFEQAFDSGSAVSFLPHWWANEVSSGSTRIHKSETEGMGGGAALAAVPTSSFSADIRLLLDTRGLPGVALNFWARSAKNGSGTRSAEVWLSFSANGGDTFTDPVQVGQTASFPNANTEYELFSFMLPAELADNPQAVIRWQVKRREAGEGTAAQILLDEMQVHATTPQLQLLRVEPLSATRLQLTFNMPLQENTAISTANYQLDPPTDILKVALLAGDPKKLVLEVAPLAAGTYILTVENLRAADGETTLVSTETAFNYAPGPQFREVVINEIFADPNPKGNVRPQPVVLPTDASAEFVELFNASATPYQLQDLQLNSKQLPDFTLAPESYVLLVPSGQGALYNSYDPVVEVPGWKSLSNSGGTVQLRHTASATLLDSVAYASSWYREAGKQEGGWSLEQINPYLQCSDAVNWRASADPKGATPVAPNSVLDTSTDSDSLVLLHAAVIAPKELLLTFDQPIAPASMQQAQIILTPAAEIASLQPEGRQIKVLLATPLQQQKAYTLHIAGLTDCWGNSLETTQPLIWPRPAAAGEVVINEIMYDPESAGAEWVELYNSSPDYVDLSGWYLGLREGELRATTPLSHELLLMPPDSYLVISGSPEALLDNYTQLTPEQVLLLADMPNLRNSGDTLVLLLPDASLAEAAPFGNSMHHPLLANSKGVSLERINPAAPASMAANWTSSAAPRWSTPGRMNAQHQRSASSSNALHIDPEIVEPTPDGTADVAMIHYQLPQPGLSGSLFILDAGGREVLRLADNEILGSEGFFQWDGTNSFGDRVRNGYYVVVFSVLGTDGFSGKWLKSIIVTNWL